MVGEASVFNQQKSRIVTEELKLSLHPVNVGFFPPKKKKPAMIKTSSPSTFSVNCHTRPPFCVGSV